MRAEQVNPAVFSRRGSGETQLIYGLDKDSWLKTITAGQILKGRVLRVYSEKKYGVDFAGQERVVDSVVPLSKGDVLTGKVIGVSEHTVSMKIVSTQSSDASKANQIDVVKPAENKTAIEIEAERFKVDLDNAQQSAILSAAGRTANTLEAIRVGLYLVKLGLPITVELVRAMTSRVLENKASYYAAAQKQVPELTSDITAVESQQARMVETIANLKNFFLNDSATTETLFADAENADSTIDIPNKIENNFSQSGLNNAQSDLEDNQKANQMLFRILNASNGSHAKHRFQTLPIIIDGKLIEFDVAFFDQAPSEKRDTVLKSRCLKFALNTDLGLLNIEARIVNDRLSINFNSKNDFLISKIEEYESSLNANLIDAGWQVESMQYQVGDGEGTAAYEVVKHILQQDSLDMKI